MTCENEGQLWRGPIQSPGAITPDSTLLHAKLIQNAALDQPLRKSQALQFCL